MKTLLKNTIKKTPLYDLYTLSRSRLIYLTPKEFYIRRQWQAKFGDQTLNLINPKTYNEKLQWGKIHSNNALAKRCADKVEVLKYVKNKIGSEYTNDLIGIYPDIKSIDFNKLPQQFVLKATHNSGATIVVKNKNHIDKTKLRQIEQSLKVNFGRVSKEWVYNDIKPKIIIEKLIESEDGKSLKDYKIFCFNGKAKLIQIDFERFEGHKRSFYDTNWNKLDVRIEQPVAEQNVEKPDLLEKMLSLSEVLAEPFNHVRVDWYISNNKLIFGEMTFFHGSGFERFYDENWAETMGSWFEVSKNLSY